MSVKERSLIKKVMLLGEGQPPFFDHHLKRLIMISIASFLHDFPCSSIERENFFFVQETTIITDMQHHQCYPKRYITRQD